MMFRLSYIQDFADGTLKEVDYYMIIFATDLMVDATLFVPLRAFASFIRYYLLPAHLSSCVYFGKVFSGMVL